MGAVDEQPTPPPSVPHVLPLRGDGGADWRPVSPALARVRRVSTSAVLLPVALALGVAAALLWPWLAVGSALVVVLWAWLMWLIGVQVRAMSWAELPEELAIRRGRMWRRLITVPYGRIQYVDLSSGPYMRRAGLAEITVNTASPASSGTISGLPADVAEELRVRLAARGEAQRAGL
ncbi:PH domain-containing protein [Janibacter indicus]